MIGKELIGLLNTQRSQRHHFIKWRRGNSSMADIELLDNFLDTAKAGDLFDHVELLDMEQMWRIVKESCSERVERSSCDHDEVIIWDRPDSAGNRLKVCSKFAPEFLYQVFVVETGGHIKEENE